MILASLPLAWDSPPGAGTMAWRPLETPCFFGDDPATGGFLGDTWTWDGTSWAPYTGPGPSGRYVYTLAVR
jgi:hypothetical protein